MSSQKRVVLELVRVRALWAQVLAVLLLFIASVSESNCRYAISPMLLMVGKSRLLVVTQTSFSGPCLTVLYWIGLRSYSLPESPSSAASVRTLIRHLIV